MLDWGTLHKQFHSCFITLVYGKQVVETFYTCTFHNIVYGISLSMLGPYQQFESKYFHQLSLLQLLSVYQPTQWNINFLICKTTRGDSMIKLRHLYTHKILTSCNNPDHTAAICEYRVTTNSMIREIGIDIFDRATSLLSLKNCKLLWATLRSSPSSVNSTTI